jgi:hypothetical protein
VSNILRRHDIAPAPKAESNDNLAGIHLRHLDVLAGTDFFTIEVLTWPGLATYYVLFFLQLETRRISLAGITRHPRLVKILVASERARTEPKNL